MPIRSLQISLCGSFQKPRTVCVDDPTSSLIIGNIYAFSGTTIKFTPGCYQIVSERNDFPCSTPNVTVFSPPFLLEECEDCKVSIANAILLTSCSGDGYRIIIDKTSIVPTPSIGDVFNITVVYINDNGDEVYLTGCFSVSDFGIINPNQMSPVVSYSAQTNCETCLLNNPILYNVSECLTGDIYVISFPTNTFTNHLITFTGLDGITQFCGVAKDIPTESIVTGLLVSDLGVLDKESGNTCESCLDNVSEKKKLINCLTNEEIIVWASTLFTAGDATNISIDNGCYFISEVVVPPETPVTYNELADFDPHSNCENCLECHGATYQFSSCTEVEVCGSNNVIPYNIYNSGREIWIDSNDIATVSLGNGNIIKYDLNTQSFINTVFLGINPWGLAVDEINNVICVGAAFTNQLSFIDYTNILNYTGVTTNNNQGRKVYSDSGLFYITFQSSGVVPNIEVWSASSYNTPVLITSFGKNFEGYNDIIRIGSKIYASNYNIYGIDVFDSTTYAYEGTLSTSGIRPSSFSYDGINFLYVALNTNYYARIDITTSATTLQSYTISCNGSLRTIKINNISNKFYIDDYGCATIHEFDLTTGLLIREYNSSNLSDYEPLGIGIDSSGNTWFVGNSSLFQVGCTTDFILGSINSYEYVPIGNTFFNPILSACCEVTSISTDNTGDNNFYSLVSYSGCAECNTQSFDLFYCNECSNNLYEGLLVAPSGQYSIGDFVKSHWGNSNLFCFEIINNWTELDYGIPEVIFDAEGDIPYSSCTDCQGVATVGITIVNCETLVESQVSVTLEQWSIINGTLGFSLPVISDDEGNCYRVVNSCPIDNIYPVFQLADFYINSTQCLSDQSSPIPPRSANTETLICEQVCISGGSGGYTVVQVVPPHPVWTDAQGTEVTQLNAVALGGMFGLNS